MTIATVTAVRPGPLRIYLARRIHTMDESLPLATAVGVIGDRIVAVGDLASMAPWREGREVIVDERLRNKVLMPGFIDNHLHPFLGSLLLPTEIIAPEAWRLPGGQMAPAATTEREYLERLQDRLAARPDKADWFITFGYQPSEHGRLFRADLDRLCPDRPVIVWQRSFHELYMNSRAIEKLGLAQEATRTHPQIDLDKGHFFETGRSLVLGRLMPYLLRPQWYHKGLEMTADLAQQGGITTAGDMLFGALDPEFELGALDACVEQKQRPLRLVNILDARSFSNRAVGRAPGGAPNVCPVFSEGLAAIEKIRVRGTTRVRFSKAIKLFADGAMFSQLMQMNPPGYIDGHHGEWVMDPAVMSEGVRVFWDAGYQIHVHVNGDAGMDAVLDALAAAQQSRPRFDHRFMMHHVGFHTNAQSRRMAALGAHASVNPYYIHALADGYSLLGLGPERAAQIVRAGSMVRHGLRISLHSDFMMAPMEPLLLAWCVATRTAKSGQRMGAAECLTLGQALRAITIDAAFGLGLDHEIGSIVAGKKADFTVLEDDPWEFGSARLKDVRVAGTVFEGDLHLLPAPLASVLGESTTLAEDAPSRSGSSRSMRKATAGVASPAGEQATRNRRRYAAVQSRCCGVDADPCLFQRQLAGWLQERGPT